MYCSGHFRVLFLTAAILLPGTVSIFAQTSLTQTGAVENSTEVHLRWGARPNVTRYRLQLASDSSFADIVFDRVVAGTDYRVNDLPPGRYFWRVAPLTATRGEFSSAGVIEVGKSTSREDATPLPTPSPVRDSSQPGSGAPSSIIARGGWRAAVGDIPHPVLAHLRSAARLDLVGINSDGVIFALDAASGVALWNTARRQTDGKRMIPTSAALFLLRSRSGLDDVIQMAGVDVASIEGTSGRELWRTTLPAAASGGLVVNDKHSQILLVDNSGPRLFVLDALTGSLLTQIKLPNRLVGAPVALVGRDAGQIVLAYETGRIEVRDTAGVLVRSGDCGSPATTPPLFIKGSHGDFVLVGTRAGLIALTAGGLRPLGMVAIKDDAPRGALAAEDLNGDGTTDVIIMTDRGRVVAVNAADGKIRWEVSVANEGQSIAFADLDGDRVLDVVLAGGQSFALALSGRDGSIVWKDDEPAALVANHSVALAPRSIVTMPFGSGALLIAGDPSRTGLRAVELRKGTRPINR
jgi:outer membrane protein assembly factor BamB